MSSKPQSCCDSYERLDLSKLSLPEVVINWSDVNLTLAILVIIINNVFWHSVAFYESRTHKLSKFCNSPHVACYVFMFIYLTLIYKQEQYFQAMIKTQPTWHLLSNTVILYLGHSMTGLGVFLMGAAFKSLRVTGTFLGEVFGIEQRTDKSSFPYTYPQQILGVGSVLFHAGLSLVSKCQTGLLISLLLAVGHMVAIIIPHGPAIRSPKKPEANITGTNDIPDSTS